MKAKVINLTDRVVTFTVSGGNIKRVLPTEEEHPPLEIDFDVVGESPIGEPIVCEQYVVDGYLWEEWFAKHRGALIVVPPEYKLLANIAQEYDCVLVCKSEDGLMKL